MILGDCIYIPSTWVYQANIVSHENSLEVKWQPGSWTPDDECVKGMQKRTLSTINFSGEDFTAIVTTRDQEEKLIKKLESLLDKVLVEDAKPLDLEHFKAELVRDESLLPDLQELIN